MIARLRSRGFRTRVLVFLVSFGLAFAALRHAVRAPERRGGAPSAPSLATLGGPALPSIDLAWPAGAAPAARPIPAACAMTYADPIQTAGVLEQYQLARAASAEPPPASLQIELSHRLASGRLVVLTDGKTVLSWPFDAPEGDDWGTLSHQVSIVSGHHEVEVRILGAQDDLLATAVLEGSIAPEQVALVRADYRPKDRPSLRLAWSSPGPAEETGAVIGSTHRLRQGEDHAPTTED